MHTCVENSTWQFAKMQSATFFCDRMTNPRSTKMVTKSESRSARPKKKVVARPLKADRVQPANGNGAPPSNHDVLRRMYVSMLRCRKLTERVQRLFADS